MEQGEPGAPEARSIGRVALLSIHLEGHRQSYIELFQRVGRDAGLVPILLRSWWAGAQTRDPLVILMIEESFAGFFFTALVRAFRRRPTLALLFGGAGLTEGRGVRAAVKRWCLRAVRHLAKLTVLAISPFDVVPGLNKLADGWIYDPQLWDLQDVSAVASPLAVEVRERASGRRIVAALGFQSKTKGFDRFSQLWSANAELRKHCLFVSAGEVLGQDMQPYADAFQQAEGCLVDRFITDDELMSLYKVCDMVWAFYAPSYDQSSGIIGRALQLGRPAVVRRGSQMDRLAKYLNVPLVDGPWDDDAGIIEALLSPTDQSTRGQDVLRRLKAQTLVDLRRHLLTAAGVEMPDHRPPFANEPSSGGVPGMGNSSYVLSGDDGEASDRQKKP